MTMKDEMKRFKRLNMGVCLGAILLGIWLTMYVSALFVMSIPFITMAMLVVSVTINSMLSDAELD